MVGICKFESYFFEIFCVKKQNASRGQWIFT